jgi:hypothetical protein
MQLSLLCLAFGASAEDRVAQTLTALDTWIIAQPKEVEALPGVSFDLSACTGVSGEPAGKVGRDVLERAAVRLRVPSGTSPKSVIRLVLAEKPGDFPEVARMDEAGFAQLGEQGYVLAVTADAVILAARSDRGLRHGVTTLAQAAMDRTILPGMVIRDWPSLRYRGVQQDISRGQVPTTETLKRLADVLAEAKMNEMELYIEHLYKFKAFPDLAPPEGLAPDEARDLSASAARAGVEVHPMLQVLGHSYGILSNPKYQHLRVSACEKAPWIMTFDIRKPEAVAMVTTMIDELCEVFPGELFTVDITEIDIDGLQATGSSPDQVTDLVFGYVLQLSEVLRKHGRRLIITQGPLDSQGHLAGMGPKLDSLPKDLIVGSYYCAGGAFQPVWAKDFPRLHEKGLDFFAQAWIYSHVWLTPWVTNAAEFSDLEVSRGLQHGALGSITCDWGDAGHFHFVGEQWLPYLYHGACAWSGARLDRDYFRKAFARVVYGLTDDAAIHAMEAASDVNARSIKVRDKDGKEVEISTSFMWEFVHDPFAHADITRIVDPAAVGQMLLDAATPALAILAENAPKVKRNQDSYERWQFGVRCYQALGHKLLALGHYNDHTVPRAGVAAELEGVANEYETLQADFRRLWLAEDRDNKGYQDLVTRFLFTINPCREKAKALR